MQKTILLTGATDGIGLETAKMLLEQGHRVLMHGRNPNKLKDVVDSLSQQYPDQMESFIADLSSMADVKRLASEVLAKHPKLDVLINNAGVFGGISNTTSVDGLDVRFAVNTYAPYLLTQLLLPALGTGRVVNLSSAAQAPVNLNDLAKKTDISDNSAYAQSKLAITIWTQDLAEKLGDQGPMVVAVNPASLLGSKMVKDAYGIAGGDLSIGADILVRAALSEEFADASGKYFDNDSGRFAAPHPEAANKAKVQQVVQTIEDVLATL
ncbi:probable oxidoreductase [Vibrio sp. JCM 19236]|nr:probable oxidoreductase [Vibrio sp. JCM 19236]